VALFRHLKLTTILVVVAIVAMPTAAGAKTHRFAPATDVTVSFGLAKRHASGTVIRFARNRVSLSRTRAGALTLHASGRRTRPVHARGRRLPRVVVSLSAISGRAKLSVGRATASIAGPFSAEQAVTVRQGRGLVALRITTGRRGSTLSAATPAAAPPLPVTPAPSGTRLFAPDSVWNAPLASNAPLDPASQTLVATLRATVAQNVTAGWGPWIATYDTPPLYVASADQPTVRVQLDPGSWKVGLQQAFQAVPIPANAAPAAGADAQLTIWQPSTDRLWELFQARKLADGWHANFGGAMANVSRSRGYFDTDSWPALSQPWWGATATSLPVVAGTIMIDELQAGVIPHALAMNIPWAKPDTYSWPAQRTDGASTDANAIPEGARFRLDPNLDIDALNLPPMTRMMAKAAQRYGMIVRDQTGHAISFFAENPADLGTDPYTSPGGFYGGPYPNAVIQAFPWDHLQLLKMDLRASN
jgi:hypothetical protein